MLGTDASELTAIDDIPPVGGFLVTVRFALTLIAAAWARASAGRMLPARR